MKMAEETFYDESSAIFIAKKICNVMSVSEPEACLHGYGERRMSIMIAAKAASSTEGANHDILRAVKKIQGVILCRVFRRL